MTNERRTHCAVTLHKTVKIGLILSSTLILMLFTGTQARANIHSPQGALDVAGILPGKYTFLDALKNTPATMQKPLAAKANNEEDDPSDQLTSINELIDIMRQATETSAMLAAEEKPAATNIGAIPGLNETLIIATRVPQYKAPDARVLIQSRSFLWPVDGFIYSAFNATRGRRAHGAIDIVAEKGTPVAVAADGVVSVVANGGKNFSGYGKIVIVDHGQGVHTVYAHLDSFLVKMGQRVRKGEYIATVGRTGRVTTNLLHYEVRVAGKKIDPLTCMEHRPGVVKMVNYKSGKK